MCSQMHTYSMNYMHTQTDTNACVHRNRNFFGNHREPSVIIESPVSAIRFTHTAVNTFMPWQGFHWLLKCFTTQMSDCEEKVNYFFPEAVFLLWTAFSFIWTFCLSGIKHPTCNPCLHKQNKYSRNLVLKHQWKQSTQVLYRVGFSEHK